MCIYVTILLNNLTFMEKTIALFVLASLFLLFLLFINTKKEEQKYPFTVISMPAERTYLQINEHTAVPAHYDSKLDNFVADSIIENGGSNGEILIREDKNKNSGGDGGGNGTYSPPNRTLIGNHGGAGGRGEIQINGVNLTFSEARKLGLIK
jgi:hypothetical protein